LMVTAVKGAASPARHAATLARCSTRTKRVLCQACCPPDASAARPRGHDAIACTPPPRGVIAGDAVPRGCHGQRGVTRDGE
jgi:hypothetical protein